MYISSYHSIRDVQGESHDPFRRSRVGTDTREGEWPKGARTWAFQCVSGHPVFILLILELNIPFLLEFRRNTFQPGLPNFDLDDSLSRTAGIVNLSLGRIA